MTSFYKTNHPDVIAAVEAMRAEHEAMWEAGKAFAELFGGKPFHLHGAGRESFGGLIFTPTRDKTLWTMPDRNGAQAPRAKPRPGATEAQRKEHKELREKWLAAYPKKTVHADAVYKAIGTDWGSLLFSGIGYAERNGWFYVTTKAPLNDRMTEILGSEYKAAFEGAA